MVHSATERILSKYSDFCLIFATIIGKVITEWNYI